MNINKKAISLIELLFTIVIGSILLLSISNISLDLNIQNNNEYEKNIIKIEFESTRLFLQKIIKNDKFLDKLIYKDETLFLNNNVLLKNVNTYSKSIINDDVILNICIRNKIQMCQNIRIKYGI